MRGRRLWIGLLVVGVLGVGAGLAVRRMLGSDLIRAALERQLSEYLQQPVSIGSATASLFPRVAIVLHDVAIAAPAVQLRRVRIATGLRPLLSRVVDDGSVVIDGGQIQLPLPFALAGSATPATTGPSPLTVSTIRSIELRDLALSAGGQTWRVDAAGSVNGDRLDISRLSANAAATRLQAAGALASIGRLEGEFTATADPLDLDELLAFGTGLARTPDRAGASTTAGSMPMRLTVVLGAPAGRFSSYAFRDLSTTVVVAPGTLTLAPFGVSAFGGTFRGRLDADTQSSMPAFKLAGRAEALDITELMKAAGSAGGITGSLGGDVRVAASGTDTLGLLRSARGSIVAAITNGSMPRLEIVRPLVLAFGKPSGAPPEGSGSAFSRLGGTFALAGGTVSSGNIAMAARDFDMNAEGSLQLVSGSLSARGDVVLSRELTAQAGVDFRRVAAEDGRIVVPATFGGTLQQPAVSLDVAAATRRALGNELQRRARSFLDGLLKRKTP